MTEFQVYNVGFEFHFCVPDYDTLDVMYLNDIPVVIHEGVMYWPYMAVRYVFDGRCV
jgi:hypothetical protein